MKHFICALILSTCLVLPTCAHHSSVEHGSVQTSETTIKKETYDASRRIESECQGAMQTDVQTMMRSAKILLNEYNGASLSLMQWNIRVWQNQCDKGEATELCLARAKKWARENGKYDVIEAYRKCVNEILDSIGGNGAFDKASYDLLLRFQRVSHRAKDLALDPGGSLNGYTKSYDDLMNESLQISSELSLKLL